jgi:hypothetical protein
VQAVLMTFVSDVPVPALRQRLERYTVALSAVPGLIMKTWIIADTVIGGFYLFEDRPTADAYLHGDVCETLITDASLSYLKINHFDVIDDLSVIAGTPWSAIHREVVLAA